MIRFLLNLFITLPVKLTLIAPLAIIAICFSLMGYEDIEYEIFSLLDVKF